MKRKTLALAGLLLIPATAALAAAAATASAAAADDRAASRDLWLHVNVQEAAGGRVHVNLPVAVVEKAAALVPDDARHYGRVRMGRRDVSAAQLREIWRAVKDGPDATFVTVDEKDSKVRVAKRGGYLLFRADEARPGRSQVDVRVPIPVVEALLSGAGDELDIPAALQALARQGEGELVTVDDEKDTVRIWVDGVAESR